MEYDTGDKETLIKAIRSEVEVFGASFFRRNYARFFSDDELHKKSVQQLREVHSQLQKDAWGFLNKCTDDHKEDLANWLDQSENDADYLYWCRVPIWSIWESALLLLGKDPEKVGQFKLEEYQRRFPLDAFTVKFKRLISLLSRYMWCGELKNQIPPSALLTWAEQLQLEDIPIGLKETLLSLGKHVDWKIQYEQLNKQYNEAVKLLTEKDQQIETLSNLESNQQQLGRKTLLKMILGMAMHKYAYDPAAKQNAATGSKKNSIHAGLALSGISVTDETIKAYLDEAKDIVLDIKN
ncbi:hypothetical protein [Legionella fallonii]|uniref:Uncharacterized protein n=1 Tax=Legionella fallonii LLAP-10 TaxID=1212491 RepID=A0A098FZM3_9GAMM|nr:hypothetical protein [Legionella fallonii]CEG55683.1 protein of unknown function [Legionella fallonii LLAP-10]